METVKLSTHLNSLACAYKEIPPYLALLSGIAILLLILVSRKSASQRVAAFLRVLAAGEDNAAIFSIPMSRQDIADYLGLNADTLSRVLTRLKQSGVIALTGRSDVLVRDIARLRALSPLGEAIERICRNGGTA